MIEPMDTSNLPTEEKPANTEENPTPPTRKRGFAAMSPERRKQVTSKGGKEAHAAGLANKFTKETAREAGKLGGAKTGADRARMAAIGRLGGLARRKQPVAQPTDEAVAPPTVPSDEPCDDKEASREK
ncbi:MAG: hypothetical protein KA258_06710 [Deltaproteobacteria bacterium]|nr:hypothetical protein [Deltaproteobacteria bacterium]